jgi:hypothetical protein
MMLLLLLVCVLASVVAADGFEMPNVLDGSRLRTGLKRKGIRIVQRYQEDLGLDGVHSSIPEHEDLIQFVKGGKRYKEDMVIPRSDQVWLGKGSVAEFLGLPRLDYVDLEVSIDLYFVGFAGNGHNGVDLGHEEVQAWLEHLDHSHAQVLHTSLGHKKEASARKNQFHMDDPLFHRDHVKLDDSADISYTYKYRLAAVPADFVKVLQRVYAENYRVYEEGVGDARPVLQISIDAVTQALQSFLATMQTPDNRYSVFIVNPDFEWVPKSILASVPSNAPLVHGDKPVRYGFRFGLSDKEIDEAFADDEVRDFLASLEPPAHDIHTATEYDDIVDSEEETA